MKDLVVASFNIRNGLGLDGRHVWPLRRHATAAAIGRLEADVVGLQEVYRFQRRYLLRRLAGYQAHGEERDGAGRGEACPVLTRESRLEVTGHWTRWFGEDPDHRGGRLPGASFPRLATGLEVSDRESGTAFAVVNTHLDEHRPANRLASVAQLVTWLDPDRPALLMGDLNATPADEEVFAAFAGGGLDPALPADAPGTSHNFRGGTAGPRIDHILVSRHWEVLDAGVAADHRRPLPSDHWPVRARLRLRDR